jgi:hypothetical protein
MKSDSTLMQGAKRAPFFMPRVDAWPVLLAAYERAQQNEKFVWGQRDCVLVALGAAEAMLAVNCTGGIAGSYSTAKGASRAMRKLFKAKDLEGAADAYRAVWGGEEITPLFAGRGDIALASAPTPEGHDALALGFVGIDGRNAKFAAPVGLTSLPLKYCMKAWRIG